MSGIKDFYTTGEVSRILGIAQKTVKNYCDNGKLSCEKTPMTNYRRITRAALERFIGENNLRIQLCAPRSTGKILIVDDDETFSGYLETLLSAACPDAEIALAFDGYEACMKAVRLLPDVVILDLKLPKEDGVTVFRKIRQHELTRNTEIIVVTAFLDERSRKELALLDAQYILGKPLRKAEFLRAVRKAFTRRNATNRTTNEKS